MTIASAAVYGLMFIGLVISLFLVGFEVISLKQMVSNFPWIGWFLAVFGSFCAMLGFSYLEILTQPRPTNS